MNQFVNHTASDQTHLESIKMDDDIRAISALQTQVDYLQEDLRALTIAFSDLEKAVERLQDYKAVCASYKE